MSDLEDIEVWWKRLGCIRNPGTHTGEEAARDAEIKDLRQALAERVSHLELLKKYMIAVQKEQAVHMREVENTEVFKTMSHEELVVLWDLESEIHNG